MTNFLSLISGALLLTLTACSSLPDSKPNPRSPASTHTYANCRMNDSTDMPISLIHVNENEIAVEMKSVPYAGTLTKLDAYGAAKNSDVMTHYARLTDTAQSEVLSFWIEKMDNNEIVLREVGLVPTEGRNPKQVAIGENSAVFLDVTHAKDSRGVIATIVCGRFE